MTRPKRTKLVAQPSPPQPAAVLATATAPPGPAGDSSQTPRAELVMVCALALLVRVASLLAGADRAWIGSWAFLGDARVFLEAAEATQRGALVDLGLPLRPPGTGWIVQVLLALGITSPLALELVWTVLGAAAVGLGFVAARRSLGPVRGLWAGVLLAGSNGLIVLSTSLGAETPYLVLTLAAILVWQQLEGARGRVGVGLAVLGGGLHAGALLVRSDHLLLLVAQLGVLWWRGERRGAVVLATTAGVVLAPWHLEAWDRVARFNRDGPPVQAGELAGVAEVERQLAFVGWSDAARREADLLPIFARREAKAFVTATVAWRDRARVEVADLDILEQAFGARPTRLPEHFWVSLYGPLNLALANHPQADPGFDRLRLELAPPLEGGRARYPPLLLAGLPPTDLSFSYPPHVSLVVDGTAIAWSAWRESPVAMAQRAGHKLARFWSGAALGLGGWNWPLGASGTRRAVDMVVPVGGPVVVVWRLTLLGLVLAGGWRLWGRRGNVWVFLLACRVVPAVVVFGYARFGALAIPAVVVLALAAFPQRRPALAGVVGRVGAGRRLALGLALLLAVGEVVRGVVGVEASLDGAAPAYGEDVGAPEREVAVEFRVGVDAAR